MDVEQNLGFEPIDRESEKLGYDIESKVPESGKLRFIEHVDQFKLMNAVKDFGSCHPQSRCAGDGDEFEY